MALRARTSASRTFVRLIKPMQVEREKIVEELFMLAVELSPGERQRFLERHCGTDPQLRDELQSLLDHDQLVAESFLAGRVETLRDVANIASDTPRATPADVFAQRYHPVRVIGEGSYGTVLLAKQQTPVRREVALKILKSGLDAKHVLARFEIERQAVAMLDHPNIASIYDAGTTPTGRPFVAMEYVAGVPITQFCDERKLSVWQRLELFLSVCDAIQHAHQKGIIHRDLKPANILVTERDGRPVVKVIDFGVAKAIDHQLSTQALVTEMGQLIGTPEYMSPEQINSDLDRIDTRTDTYSLGALLYELLCGRLPFDSVALRGSGASEMRRLITEVAPPSPSQTISDETDEVRAIATNRSTTPKQLRSTLFSELEWIPLRALRKEPQERYRSPAELADDIRNYLGGRPLMAGPESWLYRARKFSRRNRALIAGVAIVSIALIAGTVGLTVGLFRVRAASRDAAEALTVSEQVRSFLVDMLRSAGPDRAQGEVPKVTDLLDKASPEIERKFGDRPLVAAELHDALATTYWALQDMLKAAPHEQRVYDLRKQALGENDPRTIEARSKYGWFLSTSGNDGKTGLEQTKAAYDQYIALHKENDRAALSAAFRYALALINAGRPHEAEAVMRDTLKRQKQFLGPDDDDVASSEMSLGGLLANFGSNPEIGEMYRDAFRIIEIHHGPKHPLTLMARNQLAWWLSDHDPAEAEKITRELVELRRQVLGSRNIEVATNLALLGKLLRDRDDLAGAEKAFGEAVDIRFHSEMPPDFAAYNYRSAWIDTLAQQGKLDQALPLAEQHLRESKNAKDSGTIAGAERCLAYVYLKKNQPERAEPLVREASEIFLRGYGKSSKVYWDARLLLADTLSTMGRYDEAGTIARDILQQAQKIYGDNSQISRRAQHSVELASPQPTTLPTSRPT